MERSTLTTPALVPLHTDPSIHQFITPFPVALPAAGTSAVWKDNPESFRGYRLNDDPARRDGLWSDIASISVMG